MRGIPNARYADRCNQIIRQWRLLVLLRRAPRTLPELAQLLECTERTVRRDIYALQAVPLPIGNKYPAGEGMEPGPMKGRPHGRRVVRGSQTGTGVNRARFPIVTRASLGYGRRFLRHRSLVF
jgi:hypothetical protein